MGAAVFQWSPKTATPKDDGVLSHSQGVLGVDGGSPALPHFASDLGPRAPGFLRLWPSLTQGTPMGLWVEG